MPLNTTEKRILRNIPRARSDNDPENPEFPPDKPRFPATPTYRIIYNGFTKLFVKDESFNPTGTHKDRLAWELVCQYRHFLEAKQNGHVHGPLPQFSMISSGNAAMAIGTAFQRYGLPKLRALIDIRTPKKVVRLLQSRHCEVFMTDLSIATLTVKDILRLTHNPHGFDVTSNDGLDRSTVFYDWLSFEIIKNNPDYILCPFGTGELYENICNVLKREAQKTSAPDPRLHIATDRLGKIHVIGATVDRADTIADKLYAPHLPFSHFSEQWLRFYRDSGYIGARSGVYIVDEQWIERAYEWMQKKGIRCEPSGAAGMAYLMQHERTFPKTKKIVVVNTGKGLGR